MTTNTLIECAECEDVWRAAKCVRVPGRYQMRDAIRSLEEEL